MAKKKGVIRFILVAVLAAATVGAGYYGLSKGADSFAKSSYFKVKSVSVRGLIKADPNKVESMVKTMVGRSIFDIDPATINYQQDSWVERMEIRKVFPDKLDVVVFEKRPVFKLVSRTGCFTATSTGLLIKDNCSNVHVRMEKALTENDLKEFINIYESTAYLKNKDIELKQFFFSLNENGVKLMAPYSKDDFSKLYSTYQKVVKSKYQSIEYVDMRVPDKIFVKGVM